MEWLYRCMKEPKRLFKRYFVETCSSSITSVSSSWEYTRILSKKSRITFFGRTYMARLSIAKLRVVPIHRYRHYPNAQVYNLDIVKPGTPNPVVKDYKPALRDGQKLQSSFIEYDIRKPIENLPFTPTEDDVIFNFAAEELKKVTGLIQFVPDIPNWVIMPMARAAMLLGSPMGICPARVKKLQISTNICGEKLKNCGYQFKWSFEEALADWFEDNDRQGLK